MLMYIAGLWTFDAYHDRKVTEAIDNNRTAWTYEAGKLLLPYILAEITPQLWTIHLIEDRAATLVCRRLGFKEIKRMNSLIIMRRDKDGN